MLVISIPIGVVVTLAIVVWIIVGALGARRRKRWLEQQRAAQEAGRLRALEKALRPPLLERIRGKAKLPWKS